MKFQISYTCCLCVEIYRIMVKKEVASPFQDYLILRKYTPITQFPPIYS